MLLNIKLIIVKVNYFILNDFTAAWLMKKKRKMQLFDDGRTTVYIKPQKFLWITLYKRVKIGT